MTITRTRRTIAEAAVLAAILAGLFGSNAIGVYDGANKGVFVGDCGLEIVGEPGFFCAPPFAEPDPKLVSA